MFQATVEEFKAAVVARCFIVGFRFYRQSPANKARLAYAMANAVQESAFGNIRALDEFSINNLHKLFTSVATAQRIMFPENWAARVLLLSSTMFLASTAICQAAEVEANDETKEAILVEFERCMSLGGADAHLISLAVSGHTRLSQSFSQHVPEHYQAIFDEDGYPEAGGEVPRMPELMSDWRASLVVRRQEQREAFNAAQVPDADSLSDAMADALGEAPEYNENLNREDIEAQYSCNTTEDDDVDR